MTLKSPNAKTNIESSASDAVKVIAQAASDNVKILANAASEATKLIATATEAAAKVVANSAAEATKIVNVRGSEDHDLLIELRTKMEGLREDIKGIKDGTATKISDHEARINSLEGARTKQITVTAIGVGILTLILTFISIHIFKQ